MVSNFVVYLIVMIISAVVSYAMRPKPVLPDAAKLDDFDVPTAEEGRPIPVIFGTVWLGAPNVIWYGDLATSAIKKKAGK